MNEHQLLLSETKTPPETQELTDDELDMAINDPETYAQLVTSVVQKSLLDNVILQREKAKDVLLTLRLAPAAVAREEEKIDSALHARRELTDRFCQLSEELDGKYEEMLQRSADTVSAQVDTLMAGFRDLERDVLHISYEIAKARKEKRDIETQVELVQQDVDKNQKILDGTGQWLRSNLAQLAMLSQLNMLTPLDQDTSVHLTPRSSFTEAVGQRAVQVGVQSVQTDSVAQAWQPLDIHRLAPAFPTPKRGLIRRGR